MVNPSQCDVWEGPSGVGGGSGSPPPAILALGQNFAQKSCFPKGWHQFQLIWPLFGIFFQKSPKKIGEYWKSVKKWLNMSEISKFCNFWAISTSKESIFHLEFILKQKKYDLLQEKLKKIKFFHFFFSKSMLTSCLQTRVSQICAKKFKNWVHLCFGNVLKLKVTKGELIISIHLEMADG